MNKIKNLTLLAIFLLISVIVSAEDGYNLWLRYKTVSNEQIIKDYRNKISVVVLNGSSPTMKAIKEEIGLGLSGLLGAETKISETVNNQPALIIGIPQNSTIIAGLKLDDKLKNIGKEGYLIENAKVGNASCIIIAANTEIGLLYGTFHFLRLMQSYSNISNIAITSTPKIQVRILNHWDNIIGTVERGYAGESLWKWHELPEVKQPRYKDYARANASIGINGTVVNNVNASPLILSKDYITKIVTLADIFRPYGIKVYVAVNFSSPKELGKLKTSDPLDPDVREWWKKKADEIYSYIPDFGGFLVKANSEGLPGPQDFGRTHADGANMLAEALAPHGGIVMWRAFVYKPGNEDRAAQGYNEFHPLDGKFAKNVLIQVKNGPIDFQPREPFHPLFGAMPKTPIMMEFQITQEYLGFATHLAYLAPLFKECLETDTYSKGQGSSVARVIDGSLHNYSITAMAGVANTGSDRNWTGHPMATANWYAFGRLAWNHSLTPENIAEEWIKMTFSNDKAIINTMLSLMMPSREAVVNYMTPFGLAHLMGVNHHYGPQPWYDKAGRPDWNPVYYHKADNEGLGFDRSATGSNQVAQYFPPLNRIYGSLDSCPENLILWFHHVNWDRKMKSGNTLWNELCLKYNAGLDTVKKMQQIWNTLEGKIDADRFEDVKSRLKIQERDARWWKDACLLYFQTFSKMPFPDSIEKPTTTFDEIKNIYWRYAPGIFNN